MSEHYFRWYLNTECFDKLPHTYLYLYKAYWPEQICQNFSEICKFSGRTSQKITSEWTLLLLISLNLSWQISVSPSPSIWNWPKHVCQNVSVKILSSVKEHSLSFIFLLFKHALRNPRAWLNFQRKHSVTWCRLHCHFT